MTDCYGYMGRLLDVDLSSGALTDEALTEPLMRDYIGGYGLGARLLYERMPRGADALGPDNILGFLTGVLTGTPACMSGRYTVVAKSPLTGGWGDANSGGRWGPELKFAGYDGVLLRGISPEPVYLTIEDGRAELRPAGDVWGMDCVETEEALKARHGADAQVASIGPAGERLSLISGIMTDRGRAAGRSGLGAVMGSKRLKAIVVRGSARPRLAHPERVKELRAHYQPMLRGGEAEAMNKYGTSSSTKDLVRIGRTPIQNWRGGYPDDFSNPEALTGSASDPYHLRRYACWGCALACGAILKWSVDGVEHQDHRPEYETLATFGTYLQNDDLPSIMSMNEICNRAGLDTISAGATVAFAIECAEQGLFTPSDLDGLKLEWGNGQAAMGLLQRMVRREGLGDLLADGALRAAQRIGRGSEAFAIHAGGQELPAHDPRHTQPLGLMYAISPTPGRHTQGGALAGEVPSEWMAQLGVDPKLETTDPLLFQGKGYAATTALNNTLSAAGLCQFGLGYMGLTYTAEFIDAVTGWGFDMAECIRAGERIETVRHLFSLREGANPLHVRTAARALGQPPLERGPRAGVSVQTDDLRDAYLRYMGWDRVTGLPTKEALRALGLSDLRI